MIGTTIGRYRIKGQLGAGGMGVVYRAHDERLGRDIALKVLPAGALADETARARLLREARTASSLNHPHVCTIYEVLEEGGSVAIAMEMVEGRTLRELVALAPLPIDSATRYGAQIADALAHAHERGVVHRDLKSANVVITPEGRAKVLDFGLAKRASGDGDHPGDDALQLTQSGLVVGTPAYLAPEVLSGAASDARSDIWALGVVLYEMVAGKLPFGGRSVVEVATAIINDPAPPLSPRVPPGLRATILRCLAKEPGQRYRTASEVRASLETLQHDASVVRPHSGPLRRRSRRWLALGLVVAGATVAVVAGRRTDFFRHRGPANEGRAFPAPPRASSPRFRSIAVLPLANLGGDAKYEYFADGMTEELITNLAPIGALKVISRTSVMRFKGTQKPLPEIARELGVDAVIEGSVLRSEGRVRITAQLIDAASDRHLWAKSYERELRDVITLQREVAIDIAKMIQVQLTPQEHARMEGGGRAVNPGANDLYLEGVHFWDMASDEAVRKSIGLFERAIALDPDDPRYYTGIANAHLLLAQIFSTEPLEVAMPKVEENARKALARDEASAEAHTSMGAALFFGNWDWAGAKRELVRALELNPGLAQAHLLSAIILGAEGHADEAIQHDLRARELDPFSVLINWDLATELAYAGRLDDAIAQARKTVEIAPTSALPHSQIVTFSELKGDFATALDVLETYLPAEEGGTAAVATLRAAYAAAGPRGYLRACVDRALAMGGTGPAYASRLAQLYARLGETEKALSLLENTVSARGGDALFLKVDPCLASLRGHPRFNDLLHRAGLAP
jgi:serine/threonine protein kinase/tetratricopeptide (TPR) repeat protein